MGKRIKVGLLLANPETIWRTGGGELHTQKYFELLNPEEFEVDYFHPLKFKNVDILHYFGSNYQLNDFGKYAQREGIKVVGTPILFPVRRAFRHKMYLRFSNLLPTPTTILLRKCLLQNSDLVIANSLPEAKHLTDVYAVDSSKVRVLGTGVDSDFLTYLQGSCDPGDRLPFDAGTYWIMVGRVLPLKGQVAVATLFASMPGSQLLIVGQPSPGSEVYANELELLVAANQNIFWVKGIDHESPVLKELYSRAIGHILWSHTEVAALVNLEAGALGTLVLSRGHETTRSILKGHAFYAQTISELKAQIRRLEQISVLERAEVTSRLRAFIEENFLWSALVSRTAELYRKILSIR